MIDLRLVAGRLLLLYMFFLLVIGLFSPFEYNILPAVELLELLFLLLCIICFYSSKGYERFLIAGLFVLYIFSGWILASSNGVHILDFVQAYKAFIYVALLLSVLRNKTFHLNHLYSLYWLLLIFFSLKYTYSVVLDFTPRMGSRPAIIAENNFELMLPVILYAFLKDKVFSRAFQISLILLYAVVFISGSRSALICLIFVTMVMLTRLDRRSLFFSIVAFFTSIPLINYIFIGRLDGESFESVDRVKFFDLFLYEINEWSFFNYLFGSNRLTPLSDFTCLSLRFYEGLFSFSNDGSCYSVILHSYNMRALFDHGFVFFICLFLGVYYVLKTASVGNRVIIAVMGCIFLSGFSVSAFNNVFVSLSLLLISSCIVSREN